MSYESHVISFNHVRENHSWVFLLNIARLGLNLKIVFYVIFLWWMSTLFLFFELYIYIRNSLPFSAV